MPVKIVDIRSTRCPRYAAWAVPLLNDPRDSVFVGLIVQCALLSACGVAMFFAGPWLWHVAALYWVVLAGGLLDRFTLMLHCTSHRQLFRPRYRVLNLLVPWVLGPFFGQTPETYFAHHMGMHHNEENLSHDISSTMRFQRDRFDQWLRYWGRFMAMGVVDLSMYMKRRGRHRLLQRILVGEGVYWSVLAILVYVRPGPAFVVLVAPLVVIRTMMMIGNWGQHAFVAAAQPDNPYVASITCINSRYNRRCFNDGYHIGHHLHSRLHWTEYPQELETNLAEYGRNDAIVFDGLDFFMVWFLLITRRWSRLAHAFVQLPGAPLRTEAQIVQLLRERVGAVPIQDSSGEPSVPSERTPYLRSKSPAFGLSGPPV